MTKTQTAKVLAAADSIGRLYTSVAPVLIAASDLGDKAAGAARDSLLDAVSKLRTAAGVTPRDVPTRAGASNA